MKKTMFLLMIVTIVSKFFGLLRDVTLSYYYGTSYISDVFIISTTIPVVIFSFIMMGISSGFIPIYSKVDSKYGSDKSLEFTNSLINLILIISTVIVITILIIMLDRTYIDQYKIEFRYSWIYIKFKKKIRRQHTE